MTTLHRKYCTTQEVVARFTELAKQEKWFGDPVMNYLQKM